MKRCHDVFDATIVPLLTAENQFQLLVRWQVSPPREQIDQRRADLLKMLLAQHRPIAVPGRREISSARFIKFVCRPSTSRCALLVEAAGEELSHDRVARDLFSIDAALEILKRPTGRDESEKSLTHPQ